MGADFDPGPMVEGIWREIGYRPAFPRDLIQPIMEIFDLAVVLLPRLSISVVSQWLAERGRIPIQVAGDRLLAGCLLAQRGRGLAFIDGSLDPDERRFAVAHEFAHFFGHYLAPRRRAIARFGDAILPVLDGDRPATVAERLSEILRQAPLGPFEDFLARDAAGVPSAVTLAIETEADLIALELLAPRAETTGRLGPAPAAEDLQSQFGLPPLPAALWASFLAGLKPAHDPLILSIEQAIRKNA